MKQDDATYTVTISGPGFSVTAERSGAPQQRLIDVGIAASLRDALVMLSGKLPWMDAVLAAIVADVVKPVLYRRNKKGSVDRCSTDFWKAAHTLMVAYKDDAVDAVTPDDRGGV